MAQWPQLEYLDGIHPATAVHARTRYACLEQFGTDIEHHGYAAGLGISTSCEREVVRQLIDLRNRAAEYAARDGYATQEQYFFAEQNARLVRNAEQYYRSMFAACDPVGGAQR
jgi:erythromycin esterase-like protein